MTSKLSMNSVLKGITSVGKKPKSLIILGFIGIFLIFLSSYFPNEKTEEQKINQESITAEEYKVSLENGIKDLVKEITGDTKAKVVITLDSGIMYSYAKAAENNSSASDLSGKTQESHSNSHSFVTVRTADGGEQALLITEYMPEVRGIAIVCRGGNDEQTAEKIQNAVMAALNITSKRVYITGGNSYEKR